MTPPDYAARLADRSPDGARASFLSSLRAPLPVPLPRALRNALGLPAKEGGSAWLAAWRALGVARREDAEVREACEGAEARAARAGKERSDEQVQGAVDPATREATGAEQEGAGGGISPVPHAGTEMAPAVLGEVPGAVEVAPAGWAALMVTPDAEPFGTGTDAPRLTIDDFRRSHPDAPDGSDAWSRARREGRDIARERGYVNTPVHFHTLLWIDRQCARAGMHALDAWWLGTLLLFYASGKLVLVCRVGLRGAKSVTICRSLVNDALFGRCDIDPGTVAVIPIMSADRTEATDRFHTIKAILAACGVRNDKGEDEGAIVSGGLGMSYRAKTLPSGGGVIEVVDCEGRTVEFRIYPARLTGVIGHTDKAGFGDELDTWPVDLGVDAASVAQRSDKGKANPADVVLDRWLERFTTTRRTAHLYLVSASYYGEETAHARKVREGDTSIQMVARLGALGADRDNVARASLEARIRVLGRSSDSRLLVAADPFSTDVPAWVTSPVATIEDCYALSRDRLGPMFGRYGGRPDEAEGGRGPLAGVAFPGDAAAVPARDAVIGLAPMGGGWGRVMVGLVTEGWAGGAFVVMMDQTGAAPFDDILGASVLACATDQARAVEAERLAWLSGRPAAYLPPVAPQAIYDGHVLRLSPLRTLYERGRLRHAPGLETLEAALRSHRDDSERNPRLEALLAAVMRLVACYPWLAGGAQDEAPWRGPGAVGAIGDRGEGRADVLRRLGAG